MIKGFDTTDDTTSVLDKIVADGYEFIGRYVNGADASGWKILKKPEADAIHATGKLKIVTIYETSPTKPGYFRGAEAVRDIANVHKGAIALGQPRGSGYCLTVDFPASETNLASILDYFTVARQEIKAIAPGEEMPYALGAYADGYILQLLKNKGLIDFSYLAGARLWPGSEAFPNPTILQSPPSVILGLNSDPCIASTDSYFGW